MSAPNHAPPVLLIGMHRSGTTMVARLLDQLGIFMGWRLLADHEPALVVRLNNWLLQQCGGSWDNPLPIRNLLENQSVRALATDYIRAQFLGLRTVSFLGPRRFLEYGTPERVTEPWGFKDPRLTFTLPIWLDLFPRARVIHIYRHGVDVADSLRRRHESIFANRRARYERYRAVAGLIPKRGGFTTSVRVATLEGGLSLWEEYMTEASSHIAALGSNGLSVRYEDFLAQPEDELTRIMGFCETSVSAEAIARVARSVRSDRAFSFLASEETLRIARLNDARLNAFGYRA